MRNSPDPILLLALVFAVGAVATQFVM